MNIEEAIAAFLEAQQAANRAAKTVSWYRDILTRFHARRASCQALST